MYTIILLSDDSSINSKTTEQLSNPLFSINIAHTFQHLFERNRNDIDCILATPEILGHNEVNSIQKIKRHFPTIPLVIVSNLYDDIHAVLFIEAGADEFLILTNENKRELVSRIKRVIRIYHCVCSPSTSSDTSNHVVSFGDLSMYLDEYNVFYKGQQIFFTVREFQLLNILQKHRNEIVSRPQINTIWNKTTDTNSDNDRAIDAYIYNIRKKLTSNNVTDISIASYRGKGYMLIIEENHSK
ncbi:response regulator transcription factor [Shouchella shacheensis]|uniref:response regulator transcription factor n=1 Tax=Shouchella shacheensis TaxID=1649580 RepID=UPI00073FCFE5|nr:response regulator transcription factor [Shouchella shacheensis]